MNNESIADDCYSPLLFETPSCEKSNSKDYRLRLRLDHNHDHSAITPVVSIGEKTARPKLKGGCSENDRGFINNAPIEISSSPESDCLKHLDLEECVLDSDDSHNVKPSPPSSPDLPRGLNISARSVTKSSTEVCEGAPNNESECDEERLDTCVLSSDELSPQSLPSVHESMGSVTTVLDKTGMKHQRKGNIVGTKSFSPLTSSPQSPFLQKESKCNSDNDNSVWDQFDDCGMDESNFITGGEEMLGKLSHDCSIVCNKTLTSQKQANSHDSFTIESSSESEENLTHLKKNKTIDTQLSHGKSNNITSEISEHVLDSGCCENIRHSPSQSSNLPVGLNIHQTSHTNTCRGTYSRIHDSYAINRHKKMQNQRDICVLSSNDEEECSPQPLSSIQNGSGRINSKAKQTVGEHENKEDIFEDAASSPQSPVLQREKTCNSQSANNSVWDQFDDCGIDELHFCASGSEMLELGKSCYISSSSLNKTLSSQRKLKFHDSSIDSSNKAEEYNLDESLPHPQNEPKHDVFSGQIQPVHINSNKLTCDHLHSAVHNISSDSESNASNDAQIVTDPVDPCGGSDSVWDQFDDCGAMEDVDFYPEDKDFTASVLHCDVRNPDDMDKLHTQESELTLDKAQGMIKDELEKLVQDEFDPPTDVETDVSLALRDANNSILWKSDNEPLLENANVKTDVKTPLTNVKPSTSAKAKKNRKKWVPPSPFTPIPKYKEMMTPLLKRACQKYGVRALPKKRMIAILEDIYSKTHKYVTDSEYEETPKAKVAKLTHNDDSDNSFAKQKQRTEKKTVKSNIRNKSLQQKKSNAKSKSRSPSKSAVAVDDSDSSSCSQECSISASQMPEESMLVAEDDKGSKLSKRDVAYKKQQIWDYLKSNQSLYEQILHYETLDFSSFHQELKSKGLNVGTNILMNFLDDINVQFTMKNQASNRWKAKKKTKKKEDILSKNK